MSNQIRELIRNTVKEVVNVDIIKYPAEQKINMISEWDSFNNLMLISRFQDENSIEFTALEIEAVRTIENLIDLVESKIIEKLQS